MVHIGRMSCPSPAPGNEKQERDELNGLSVISWQLTEKLLGNVGNIMAGQFR